MKIELTLDSAALIYLLLEIEIGLQEFHEAYRRRVVNAEAEFKSQFWKALQADAAAGSPTAFDVFGTKGSG